MCFKDVLAALRADGMNISIMQLRWAIDSGKVPPPPRDGSNRFVFDTQHLNDLREHFQNRMSRRQCEIVA